MTTSLRACLAAEAWKKLFPDENRGAHKKEGAKSPKVDFSTFAHQTFKVGKSYAKQALAILNHDPSGELLTHLNGQRRRQRAAQRNAPQANLAQIARIDFKHFQSTLSGAAAEGGHGRRSGKASPAATSCVVDAVSQRLLGRPLQVSISTSNWSGWK